MKLEPDLEYIYPVIDCPLCGKVDTPVDQIHFIADGLPKTINHCMSCRGLLDNFTVKGYVSMLELEEEGWDEEL